MIEASGNKAPEKFKYKDLMPQTQEAYNTSSRRYVDGLVQIHKNKVATKGQKHGQNMNPIDGMFNVYPNPVTSTANIIYSINEKCDVEIAIFDVTGKKIYENHLIAQTGMQNHQISVKDIEIGVYFVKVTIGSESEIKRIIITQ